MKTVVISFSPLSITVKPKCSPEKHVHYVPLYSIFISVFNKRKIGLLEDGQYDSICIYWNRRVYPVEYLKGCTCFLLCVKIP